MSPSQPPQPVIPPAPVEPSSPNFQFLACYHQLLVRYAALAERYVFDDPSTAVVKPRQFAELLAREACAQVGIETTAAADFLGTVNILRDRGVAAGDTVDVRRPRHDQAGEEIPPGIPLNLPAGNAQGQPFSAAAGLASSNPP